MHKYLLILLILTSTNTFAAISKWVDSNGQVHYSDQPPPSDAKAKTLSSSANAQDSTGSGVASTKTLAEREAELKKSQLEKKEAADKAAKKQAGVDAQQANCNTAQQNLRNLQDSERMFEIDAKGERTYMDENQREQRIAKTKKDISTYCK